MSAPSPLGLGLYFIDVLACLLFCLTLALVDARFGREVTVPVELPRLAEGAGTGSALSGAEIVVRQGRSGEELFLDGAQLSLDELAARLAHSPPASVVVRAETSTLAQVIGAAHGAGVLDIQLAYDAAKTGEAACCD